LAKWGPSIIKNVITAGKKKEKVYRADEPTANGEMGGDLERTSGKEGIEESPAGAQTSPKS